MTTLVSGGRITVPANPTLRQTPPPLIPVPVKPGKNATIMHLIAASVITLGAFIALIATMLHDVPQPYIVGNTFHGFLNFTLAPAMIWQSLVLLLSVLYLSFAMQHLDEPTEKWFTVKVWDSFWFPGVVAFITMSMAFVFINMSAIASSDPSNRPSYTTWFTGTLHANKFALPDHAGQFTITNQQGQHLTLDYKPATAGGAFTLTLLKTVAKPVVDSSTSSAPSNPAAVLQLPGAAGTVHTTGSDGKPLTYTYTRDTNGHYIINMQPTK